MSEDIKTGASSIAQALKITTADPTEEEIAALNAEDERYEPSPMFDDSDKPNDQSIPEWFTAPPGLKMPAGRVVAFMRFKAEWTDTPNKGDRVCLLWPLTSRDETFALKRTRGDSQRTLNEMAKQMIRVIDGHLVDWSMTKGGSGGVPGVEIFWNDIGAKCRQQVINYYLRTHSMSNEEAADFFGQCLHIRTVALEYVLGLGYHQIRTCFLMCLG